MIGMDSNHCRTVKEALEGKREADENTFAAIEVLSERLERLKKLGDVFACVSFSPAVKKLQKKRTAVAVS